VDRESSEIRTVKAEKLENRTVKVLNIFQTVKVIAKVFEFSQTVKWDQTVQVNKEIVNHYDSTCEM